MPVNAFLNFFDAAEGESTTKGKEKWVEVQGWDWEVDAETSWTKGGGASVGKPNPGRLSFTHDYDTSSPVILGFVCTGKAFPKAELQVVRQTGRGEPVPYFTLAMEGVYITRASQASSEDGVVVQLVELVFRKVRIDYRPQDGKTGGLGKVHTFSWDIPAGVASPSSRPVSPATPVRARRRSTTARR